MIFKTRLPFPVSVNGLYGGGSGQKRFPSKKYKAWLQSCPTLEPLGIDYPVKIIYTFSWPDKRRRDLGNYTKAPLDFLVNQGVLKDDNWEIVTCEILKHDGVKKDNPGVLIEILRASDDTPCIHTL